MHNDEHFEWNSWDFLKSLSFILNNTCSYPSFCDLLNCFPRKVGEFGEFGEFGV